MTFSKKSYRKNVCHFYANFEKESVKVFKNPNTLANKEF